MKYSAEHKYLAKHANYPPFISTAVAENLAMIIVIPSYNETKLEDTLQSLAACRYDKFEVEVIIVVNQGEEVTETAAAQNLSCLKIIEAWDASIAKFDLHAIFIDNIPTKKAGVGYARKTGMDEAVSRLSKSQAGQRLIVCLDADTVVTSNYISCIHDYFSKHPKCPAASIDYAHPLDGPDKATNEAIISYELHLRYYILAKRWAGLPYAYQTVGSAMAVRADAYHKQGGMNTRKAGEDFYFIHKFTHYADFGNIHETCIVPSARESDRVPFGTGRAMQTILASDEPLDTYAPQSFAAIAKMISQLPLLYVGKQEIKSAEAMSFFLGNQNYLLKLEELRSNTSDYASFCKRFFRWFDAFMCMKFLHFSRDQHHPNIPVVEAANWLNKINFKGTVELGETELLTNFRVQSKLY